METTVRDQVFGWHGTETVLTQTGIAELVVPGVDLLRFDGVENSLPITNSSGILIEGFGKSIGCVITSPGCQSFVVMIPGAPPSTPAPAMEESRKVVAVGSDQMAWMKA